MNARKSASAFLFSISLAGLFLLGYLFGSSAVRDEPEKGRKILHYVDPMNPAHTSAEPGLAPCGMKMEPVYADGQGHALKNPGRHPGSVRVSPDKMQMLGVRIEEVKRAVHLHTIRTIGRVVPDEDRTYRISTITDGIIRNLHGSTTGTLVRKDQILASYFSREFLSAQNAYFYALNTFDRLKPSQSEADPEFPDQSLALSNSQLQSAIENLETLGMNAIQIESLAGTRQYAREIHIYAPATALILQRNISPGQRIERGAELFRLADISRVWVIADLFEIDSRFLLPESAKVKLPCQDFVFEGEASHVPPQFDPASRTLKVRLEVENPDFTLKPDMFVDVEFTVETGEAVSVPIDALADSGARKVVYVNLGEGTFEPREVETGWRMDGRVQITAGLAEGEKVVVSGNFLIDSESRMKLARAGLNGKTSICGVCGMPVMERKARADGLVSIAQGKARHFCSKECMKEFEKTGITKENLPTRLHANGSSGLKSTVKASGEKIEMCPVCLMKVRTSKAEAQGRTVEYQGKSHHFCSIACMQKFTEHPDLFPGKSRDEKKGQDHKPELPEDLFIDHLHRDTDVAPSTTDNIQSGGMSHD